jgi:hypothetical protein
MRSWPLAFVLLACVSCLPTSGSDAGGDELGSSESGDGDGDGDGDLGDGDGDGSGPADDPVAPLACWEQLSDGEVHGVWGLSTQQLLLTTNDGVLRVEGDEVTTLGSGRHGAIWATDLDNGWVVQIGLDDVQGGMVRLVDGALEPWLDSVPFDVMVLGGPGPNDLWAGGVDVEVFEPTRALAHFDGTSWTMIDVLGTFGQPPAGNADVLYQIVVTIGATYISSSGGYILVWDGTQGGTVPQPPTFGTYLSSLDGVVPFHFYSETSLCSTDCFSSVYELGDGEWVEGVNMQPSFDDWPTLLIALASPGDNTLWGIARTKSEPTADLERVVHRDAEGQWRRVVKPEPYYIYPLPDGAVLYSVVTDGEPAYRATTDCLFGG